MEDYNKVINRFLSLRSDLFKAIKYALEQDGHCKRYEGQMGMHWPNYFDDDYAVNLDCYVVGPSRHYLWKGKSFTEALDKAETDIRQWINEIYEVDEEDNQE